MKVETIFSRQKFEFFSFVSSCVRVRVLSVKAIFRTLKKEEKRKKERKEEKRRKRKKC
jgi:hypothetical protein